MSHRSVVLCQTYLIRNSSWTRRECRTGTGRGSRGCVSHWFHHSRCEPGQRFSFSAMHRTCTSRRAFSGSFTPVTAEILASARTLAVSFIFCHSRWKAGSSAFSLTPWEQKLVHRITLSWQHPLHGMHLTSADPRVLPRSHMTGKKDALTDSMRPGRNCRTTGVLETHIAPILCFPALRAQQRGVKAPFSGRRGSIYNYGASPVPARNFGSSRLLPGCGLAVPAWGDCRRPASGGV